MVLLVASTTVAQRCMSRAASSSFSTDVPILQTCQMEISVIVSPFRDLLEQRAQATRDLKGPFQSLLQILSPELQFKQAGSLKSLV